MTLLVKVLDKEGRSVASGTGWQWPLPTKGKPGKWTEPVAPSLCHSGYHGTRHPQRWLPEHPTPFRLFVFEGKGAVAVDSGDKAAFAQARLVEEITHEWPLLPIFPEFRVLLAQSWRREHGPDAQWPAWANLSRANLTRAILSGANLSGADLSGANLSRADLSGAILSRANLSGAYLSGADLSGAYLSEANLSGANLSGADLSEANLSWADLSWANLSRANLSGAYLSRAYLSRANLSWAYVGSRPPWLPATHDVDANGYVIAKATKA